MNPEIRILKFKFGNAYGPNGIIGQFTLGITTKDSVAQGMLEHQQLDNVRIWTAILKPEIEQAMWNALTKSDFPHTARPAAIVPDATMYEIGAVHPQLFPELTEASLPLHMLESRAGYKDLLDIVQSIIHQIGEGKLQGTEDKLHEVVVSAVRLNYTEKVADI